MIDNNKKQNFGIKYSCFGDQLPIMPINTLTANVDMPKIILLTDVRLRKDFIKAPLLYVIYIHYSISHHESQ